jgi:N-acetylmuramoyl-L-alanine amidase
MKIIQAMLPLGPARPGLALDSILALVLHWPAKAGQHAKDICDYWASADNREGASAHCAIDQSGMIYQALPWYEKAVAVGSSIPDPASGRIYTDLARALFGEYASNPKQRSPNRCTINIELCHVDGEGRMTGETVAAAVELCAYLCGQYHLEPRTRIVTHHLVVGWKDCPRWYTTHPEALEEFREAVAGRMAHA